MQCNLCKNWTNRVHWHHGNNICEECYNEIKNDNQIFRPYKRKEVPMH